MGRIIQPKGNKGSLKWIQHVVNDCPDKAHSGMHRAGLIQ